MAAKVLKKVGEALAKFASDVYNVIRTLLEKLAPMIEVSLAVLTYLFNSYQETLKQLRTLSCVQFE